MAIRAENQANMFTPKFLADYATGRQNNFNLIRFVAALLVLFSHSYALSGIGTDPLLSSTGLSFGNIAVHIFFITSGFLVTASLVNRADMLVFIKARALRIIPGLLVANLFTVFVIGSVYTTMLLSDYLQQNNVYRFVFTNTLVYSNGLSWTLPGVFESLPFAKVVNGSLWTLPFEVKMYGILIVIGLLAYSGIRLLNARSLRWLIGLGALALVGYNIYSYFNIQKMPHWPVLLGMFFSGSAAYLFRRWVPMSSLIAIPLLALLIYYAAGWPAANTFVLWYWLSLWYLTLYLAYVPGGPLLYFNRLGDYSYGLYIYAFPIQQALVESFPGIGPYRLLGAALVLTLIAAVLSWHFVEKRALALKNTPLPLPRFVRERFVGNGADGRR